MGFQLFTSSGTFNPASWGLKAGDNLYIVCVGGGGGGALRGLSYFYQGTYTAAASGSSSSFGSIVTARGGAGGSTTYSTATYGSKGSCYSYGSTSSGLALPNGNGFTISNYVVGGCGGHGWYPGKVNGGHAYPINPMILLGLILPPYNYSSLSNSNYSVGAAYQDFIEYGYRIFPLAFQARPEPEYQAQTIPRGGCGGCAGEINAYHWGGAGGFGYGAGGGGNFCGISEKAYGGNGGEIIELTYQLPSTSSIAVTVGNGGAGEQQFASGTIQTQYCGGGGARGCVAVYW